VKRPAREGKRAAREGKRAAREGKRPARDAMACRAGRRPPLYSRYTPTTTVLPVYADHYCTAGIRRPLLYCRYTPTTTVPHPCPSLPGPGPPPRHAPSPASSLRPTPAGAQRAAASGASMTAHGRRGAVSRWATPARRRQSGNQIEANAERSQGHTGIPLMRARKDETAVWYY
jgi:hypothetical protein